MLGFGGKQTTATTGTGALTLSAVSGYPTLNDIFGVGPFFEYSLLDSNGAPLEHGIGHLSSSTVLVRDFPQQTYASSTYDDTSPSAVSLAGTTTVIGAAGPAGLQGAGFAIDGNSANVTRYFWSPHNQFSLGSSWKTLGALTVYYVPFYNMFGIVITRLGFQVHTAAAAGKNALAGIYACKTNGYIGDLISTTGNIAVATTGFKNGTISARFFPPGWYYMAFQSDGTPAIETYAAGGIANALMPTPLGLTNAAPPIPINWREETTASLALPTTPNATTTASYITADYAVCVLAGVS